MVETRSAKKQRAPAGCLSGLPAAVIGEVLTYLPQPSRALFAVAMTNSSSSRFWRRMAEGSGHYPLSAISTTAVESSEWDELDFEEVESTLAEGITDDDLSAALHCIDAVRNLKRIKLTGLRNITGSGLQPISGSTVIEQIDLSTVKERNSAEFSPAINMSQAAIVPPILDSIISAEARGYEERVWEDWTTDRGARLKHIQLPKHWRKDQTPLMNQFISRYLRYLDRQGAHCSRCLAMINQRGAGRASHQRWTMAEDGVETFTCYSCLRHLCNHNCVWEFGWCGRCDKTFCKDCNKVDYCQPCSEFDPRSSLCRGCGGVTECPSFVKVEF